MWEAATGRLVHQAVPDEGTAHGSMVFSPDSSRLVLHTGDFSSFARIDVFATDTWAKLASVPLEPAIEGVSNFNVVAFLDAGETIALTEIGAGTAGGWLHRVELTTGSELATVRAHEAGIREMVVSPDMSMIATGGSDGLVRVWETNTLQALHEVTVAGQAQGVAFVDDTHLAVAPQPGGLLVFTLDRDELLATVRSSLTRGFTPDECERFAFAEPCPSLDAMRIGDSGAGLDPTTSAP